MWVLAHPVTLLADVTISLSDQIVIQATAVGVFFLGLIGGLLVGKR